MNSRNLIFKSRSAIAASQQRGVVLLVSLLFLVVLTLLGIAASRMVTSEERQSRYLREYNTAFQAAEAALRDARDDIDGLLATNVLRTAQPRITSKTSFFTDCKYGLCEYDSSEVTRIKMDDARWTNATIYGTYTLRSPLPASAVVGVAAAGGKDSSENALTRVDNNNTRASAVTGVWQQPQYVIENIPTHKSGQSESVNESSIPLTYRVTARGYGADPNSRAMVQEIVCNPAACAGL